MTTDIKEIDFHKLHLDVQNPRLPTSIQKKDKEILTWIAKSTAIEDLMNAIGSNGYFPGEPVVAYPHPTKKDNFIVIEGNRRLTSVRLLHDPNECENPTPKMISVSNDATHRPTKIPVVVRKTRDEVLPYLGFRHVTGVKSWDSLAKARYIEQLFNKSDSKQPANHRYQEVAKIIGSRRDNIERNLDALAVYKVIEENDFFDIEGLTEETIKFAVLSTALADDRVGDFVGTAKKTDEVDADGNPLRITTNAITNPKALKKSEIKELSNWIFSKANGKTVLGESRRIPDLATVIDTPKALAALRSKSTLAYAYRLTTGVNKDFGERLYEASASLEDAAALAPNVAYKEEYLQIAREIKNLISQIGRTLNEKKLGSEDEF